MNQRQKLLRDVRALRNEVAELRHDRAIKKVRAGFRERCGAKVEAELWAEDPHWRAELLGMAAVWEAAWTPPS